FFQAEDGIRDFHVTGVQTCALPISFVMSWGDFLWPLIIVNDQQMYTLPLGVQTLQGNFSSNWRYIAAGSIISIIPIITVFALLRSEERRVGKECCVWWSQ